MARTMTNSEYTHKSCTATRNNKNTEIRMIIVAMILIIVVAIVMIVDNSKSQ